MKDTDKNLYFKFFVLGVFILSSACLSTNDNLGSLGISKNSAKYFKLSQNSLYIADTSKQIIEKLDLVTRKKTLIAGIQGTTGTDNGDATSATFNSPMGFVLVNGSGSRANLVDSIYVADSTNCAIRKIDLTITPNQVSTVIGVPGSCAIQDTTTDINPATELPYIPKLKSPRAITKINNLLYIGDSSTIRTLNLSNNALTTIAGAVTINFLDGVGTEARIRLINDMTVLNGNIFFTDLNSHAIRKLTVSSSTVSTLQFYVDGKAPAPGFNAKSTLVAAKFNRPFGIATDGSYRLFISDRQNNSVRIINLSTDQVRSVLGSPGDSFDKNGSVENGSVFRPSGIAYSKSHGILVGNHFGVHQIK